MGASGFSIHFEPLQGGDSAPLAELQPKIWDSLADFAWRYTSSIRSVWEGYLSEAGPDEEDRWFTCEGTEISFWFPDFAGMCGRSAAVGHHWIKAALAANFQAMSSVAQDHGWLPTGPPPPLSEEVWKRRTHAWIPIDGDIFSFSFEPDWEEGGIFGDDDFRPFSELDEEALEAVREAVARDGLCPCPMCVMLRPDPDFAAQMVTSLDDPNPDVALTASWYLRQTARLPVETALAMARHGSGEPRDHAATCYDVGQKLDEAAIDTVLDELSSGAEHLTRCGLLGLAAGIELDDEQAFERRLFTFVTALGVDGDVREVAAEFAGYGRVADGHEDHFARALVAHVGASDEYDHNVALTLFNFYMRADAVPRFVMETVEKLAASGSDHVQTIASFAHQQLSNRPVR